MQSLSAYRIFYTVAIQGNISNAARELYISQPAISKSIQKLEDSLGCKLFNRNSRGVSLTQEGEMLFSYVSTAFEALNTGEDRLKNALNLGIGHLKIGVSSTLCKYMLLPYIKAFTKQYPHINISILCQSTNESLAMLEEDKIDIGLIAKPDHSKSLSFHFVGEVEDIFVATTDYLNLLKARGVPEDQILSQSTLMLLDKKNMTRQYIDDYLRENQIQTQDFIEVSSMDLLIDFAKLNLGVACVIRQFIKEELDQKEFIEIPLGFPIHKREIGFCYKEASHLSKSLELFIQFFQKAEWTAH